MVAVVAGVGLGLERSSAWVLGSSGRLGQAVIGRGGDNVYVNAANGNLIVQNSDEMLMGLGPDDLLTRTYNSQGGFSANGWQANVQRRITGLTGTVNTTGSTVTRVGWDGSDIVYAYDAARGAYVAKDGAGAYDTLSYASGTNTWTWTDGASRLVEVYDNANGGRIVSSTDLDGSALTFTYTGSQLTRVTTATTAHTEYVTLAYTGANLTSVVTTYWDAAAGTTKTLTRVTYGYDGSNRLTSVTTDLTPNDNSIADGKTYVITYGYDGTSNRIASISQTDGSRLQISYVQVGGVYRVSQLTQTAATGVTRVTNFSYDTVNRVTTVTDPLGQVTTLTYDAKGQLTQVVAPPAVSGGTSQVSSFTYNGMGDLLTATSAGGGVVTYTYDANGNLTSQVDAAGNTLTRTYGSSNQLLSETRYLVPAQGASAASAPVTTWFAYDGANHLRYSVSSLGHVVEQRYNALGQVTAVIEYTANTYNTSALTAASTLTEAQLNTWVGAIPDLSAAKRTDTTYDFRGAISTVTTYSKLLSSGAGDTASDYSRVTYVYDQFGKLLSRIPLGATSAEVFTYDGLGRLLTSTEFNGGATTSIAFNDSASTSVITLANGLTKTSTYNLAGELISYSEAGSGVATATTTYRYDANGRLMMATDPTGQNTYYLYDLVGRKVADVQADGALTEYRYSADNQLIGAIAYTGKLTSGQLTTLASTTASAPAALASVRPGGQASDRYSYWIYDAAQRLVQTIDGTGASVVYAYDGASRLVSVSAYANRIAAGTLAGFKTAAPSALVAPTPDTANDRVVRHFYDADGRLAGSLDGEGYLTQILYDGAGQKTHAIAYASATTAGLRASGTFAQLLSSVTSSSNPKDIHNWFLYDARGQLRAEIDGEGGLTRYHYSALGEVDQVVRGQKLDPAGLIAAAPTLAGLPAAGTGVVLDVTAYTHNAYGQVLTMTKTLAGGASEVTTYTYDNLRRLKTQTTASGSPDARTIGWDYDARGRLTSTTAGSGGVTTYAYDSADRLISQTDPAGNKTRYYYDANGRLIYVINAAGEAAEHRYNAFGERSDVITYGSRIASGTLAGLTGGVAAPATTAVIAALANASLDSKSHFEFDASGELVSSSNGVGAQTTYSYNAFGDLTSQIDPLTASTSTQAILAYDRRGLLLSRTADAGGLALATVTAYDAFGRATQVTAPNGQARLTGYDRAGRIVTATDALGQSVAYAYDGRGNLTSLTDRNGKITTYAYDAFERQITTTTPEGLVITTRVNAYGQTVSVTDGGGRQTAYAYDLDGNLKTVTDGAGNQTKSTFDTTGRLSQVEDARGVVTTYGYDAANRVVTRTVDPTGLNLVTTYTYDAKGQQVQVVDPAGVVTQIGYDLAGQRTSVVVDPAGQALTTQYEYDLGGRVLKVVEAAGTGAPRTTQHVYDNADRLTQTIVDPGVGKLNLTTTYAYDANGQVVARTDAAGAKTRFVYDAEGRVIYTVDGAGSVTQTAYDAEGRVLTVRALAAQVTSGVLSGWPLAVTATQVAAAAGTSSNDRLVNYVYDGDGRLRYSLDANRRVSEYAYDGSGNLLHTTEYAGSIAASGSYGLAYVQAQITSNGLAALAGNRTTRHAYDAAGRRTFTIDATGTVTSFAYNATGAVTKSVVFAALYTGGGDPSLSTLQTWATNNASASNRVSRTVYDNAGRAAFSVDPESYVSKLTYNAAGQVTASTRYAARYTVNDSATVASLTTLIGSPAGAATTSYTYDAAGRLTDVVDAAGARTHLVLNALGQVVDRTLAYGTGEASTTRMTYDSAGRVLSETRAYGKAEATSTSYTYDGVGQVLTLTDGAGYVTSYSYDAAGRVLTTTTPISAGVNAVTTTVYNAFGAKVKVTDPRGNSGFFYYDLLGQLTLQVDPEGYATATTYTIGGETASVTRYALRTTGTPTPAAAPTIVTSANDATTSFARDKLGRLTGLTDALGFSETYELNAFGDRVTVTNKVGGVTRNVFDARGLLINETLNVASYDQDAVLKAAFVVNTYSYDARGNRTQMVEASGLSEARTTNFVYDLVDRLVQKTSTAFATLAQDMVTTGSATPTETWVYDKRGNVVEYNNSGARTLSYYDAANRKTAQLDPLGAMVVWTHDANGNVQTQKAYGDLVALPTTPGGTAPNPTNASNYRLTTFGYDRANRLTSTTISGVLVGAHNGTSYQTSTTSISTQLVYDAAGNVVQSIDGNGASTYFYYDKLGRKVGQVDPERYLTTYTLNKDGNVQTETRYATRLASGFSTTTVPAGTASPEDRTTAFTYDKNGQRLSAQRLSVDIGYVAASGTLTGMNIISTILYTYNGLGQVTSKTEATGEVFNYHYDLGGRLYLAIAPGHLNAAGTSVQQVTETHYDGLGNVVRTRVGNATPNAANDRITKYKYEGGKLTEITDPTGFKQTLGYGAAGRVTSIRYDRYKADGTFTTEAIAYRYDWLGRQIHQSIARLSGGSWLFSAATEQQYNAYGDLTAKGVSGQWQEHYEYDGAGRLWRSNGEDGSTHIYVRDGSGAVTLDIASNGTSIAALSAAQALNILTNNGANAVGAAYVSGLTATINVLDKRGQVVRTIEAQRDIDTSGAHHDITRQKVFNAFGEVTAEISARGYQTDYVYNTMGRLIERRSPLVSYTDETGALQSARPVERYYYDQSGRLVGTFDANNNWTTRLLLAGSGYDDTEAKVTAEFHTDGGVARWGYNVFKDQTAYTDELGYTEGRTYDKMGRVITITRPARTGLSALTDNYTYDGLGRRLSHWNNQLGSSVRETIDYDAQGRIIKTVDFAGYATSYGYAWNSTIGVSGGWTKTTINSTGLTSTEQADYFGRQISRTDFGGVITTYVYDAAGRLASQSNSANQSVTYGYFNTGRLATLSETFGLTSQPISSLSQSFAYDVDGNRLREVYNGSYYDPTYGCFSGQPVQSYRSYQNSTATYDALGRVTSIVDTGQDGVHPANISYEYDLNGNVRRVLSLYTSLVTGTPNTRQDYWYKYDSMNRVVLSQGKLVNDTRGAGITRDSNGVAKSIAYNAAGQRVSVSTTTLTYLGTSYNFGTYDNLHTEYYGYTEDGYLATVRIADQLVTVGTGGEQTAAGPGVLRAQDIRDQMGRTTTHYEYLADGVTTAFTRTATYNNISQVTSDTQTTLQSDYSTITQQTDYDYRADVGGGVYTGAYQGGSVTHSRTTTSKVAGGVMTSLPTTDTVRTYVWMDTARESTITYKPDISQATTYTTTFYYDSNGHLASAFISDGRPRTVNYVTDTKLQVMSRIEYSSATSNPAEYYYYFNGVQVGGIGNNGALTTDYATTINNRMLPGVTGPFRYNGPSEFADFSQGYTPVGPSTSSATSSSYTVRDGDTLQTIAQAVWGDANLWYLIAEANGIIGAEGLSPGRTLTIPAGVTNIHQTSSTFRVYDPNKAIGDVDPTSPPPPPPPAKAHKSCGVVGQILMAVVAIAVVAVLKVPLSTLFGKFFAAQGMAMATATAAGNVVGAATAGAVASAASQGVGIATGVQDRFSWSAVAMGAISAGVASGVSESGILNSLTGITKDVAGAVVGNVASQGIGMAVGLQSKFDWTGVATSAVLAGVGSWVSSALPNGPANSWAGMKNSLVSGAAGAIAAAGARSLIDGSDFGDNIVSALPSVIGFTVGNAIAEGIQQRAADAAAARARGDQMLADVRRTMAGAQEAIDNIGRRTSLSLNGDDYGSTFGSTIGGGSAGTVGNYLSATARGGSGLGGDAPLWDGYTQGNQRLTLYTEANTSAGLAYSGTLDGQSGNFLYRGNNEYVLLDRPGAADGTVDELVVTGKRVGFLGHLGRGIGDLVTGDFSGARSNFGAAASQAWRGFVAADASQHYGGYFGMPVTPASAGLRQQQRAFADYTTNVVAPEMNRQLAIGGGAIIATGLTLGAAPTIGAGLAAYAETALPGSIGFAYTGTEIAGGAITGVSVGAGVPVVGAKLLAAEGGASFPRPDTFAGVKEASAYLKSMGVDRATRVQILQSFDVSTLSVEQAGEGLYGLRFHDFGETARPMGQYLFETFTPQTSRAGLALPNEWNGMTGLKQWQITPGTTVLRGRAAPQPGFGSQYTGGAEQMFVLEPWKYGSLR